MLETIKVGIIFDKNEGVVINGEKKSLILDLWRSIKKELQKKYTIKEINLHKDTKYNELIDELSRI